MLFVLFCLVLTSAYETRATVISIAQVGVDQGHRSSKGECFTHCSRLAWYLVSRTMRGLTSPLPVLGLAVVGTLLS